MHTTILSLDQFKYITLPQGPWPLGIQHIQPVSFPHRISKLFGSVNETDPHKKTIQADLALEKYWIIHCSWLWLCTKFAMGNNITNFWKYFVVKLIDNTTKFSFG